MIKVAFDTGPQETKSALRGIGFYAKELAAAMQKIHEIEFMSVDAKSGNLDKFDVVHYPSFPLHKPSLPKSFPKKSVVTVHDLIYLIYPKAYPLGVKGRLVFWQQKQRLKNADAIIAVSETTKKDIMRFLRIDANKIFVVHNGPQTISQNASSQFVSQVKRKFHLPDTFVLYVGDVNYNKNLVKLGEACHLINTPLVIVGKQSVDTHFDRNHVENKSWVEFLRKFEHDKNVIRLGYLEDKEFSAIWKLASVYCQPSLYEGFGMPILESFGQEVPVVAAQTQVLVEIGADACLYVDPKDSRSIAEGLQKVLNDKSLQKQLIQKGAKRYKDFSWEKAAQETVDVYKQVLGRK